MPTATVPRRQNIIYPIPASTLALDVVFYGSVYLDPADVAACLRGALEHARNQSQSPFVNGIFRYSDSKISHLSCNVSGGVYEDDLPWSDVVVILEGMRKFFADKEHCVESQIYVDDGQRGALGAAGLHLLAD